MAKISTGIDFGTTNSTAAITDIDGVRLVPLEATHTTIPTALYFPGDSHKVYFGRDAVAQYIDGNSDGRLMRSIKRILGSPLMNTTGTKVGGQLLAFEEIIKTFIRYLKEKIDSAAGMGIENVVLGRPVHFRDNDPDGDHAAESQLRHIAIAAGFKNIEFQFEPIAAAFAHERLLSAEKLACVLDIGGGTSDFTVIRLSPLLCNRMDRSADVLASTGVRVGGNDFDKNLSLKSFMPEFGMGTKLTGSGKILPMPSAPYFTLSTWNEINDLYEWKSIKQIEKWLFQSKSPEKLERLFEIARQRLGHKNLGIVEDTKIRLSDTAKVEIIMDFLSDNPVITATRKNFDAAISDSIMRIKKSIDICLRQAFVTSGEIDLVILTGGSTEIPRINELARAQFPNAELSVSDKFSSVGMGLAYDSARKF
ncbi:MAG: Hsp70 family protein [Alphaproteobacteria bacterium]|nr:Hsp70 family protein [Alphaproteobacteria bacterium]